MVQNQIMDFIRFKYHQPCPNLIEFVKFVCRTIRKLNLKLLFEHYRRELLYSIGGIFSSSFFFVRLLAKFLSVSVKQTIHSSTKLSLTPIQIDCRMSKSKLNMEIVLIDGRLVPYISSYHKLFVFSSLCREKVEKSLPLAVQISYKYFWAKERSVCVRVQVGKSWMVKPSSIFNS